jgi:hypothetical protein
MWGELARAVRPVHADTGDCAARVVWIDAESDRKRDQLDDRGTHVQLLRRHQRRLQHQPLPQLSMS